MVRAAAKNHAHVGIVVDPADYPVVLDELRTAGSLSDGTRRRLARAAFAHTAAYDAAIVGWFDAGGAGGEPELLPPTLHLALERAEELRYGENPHQHKAPVTATPVAPELVGRRHAARRIAVVVPEPLRRRCRLAPRGRDRHPRGTRRGDHQARQPVRRRPGAVTGRGRRPRLPRVRPRVRLRRRSSPWAVPCTEAAARAVADGPQADVIVAASFEAVAIEILVAKRKATRLLERACRTARPRAAAAWAGGLPRPGRRRRCTDPAIGLGGADQGGAHRRPVARDIELAWRVCARTSSNAIVVVHDGQALGVGVERVSRAASKRRRSRCARPASAPAAARRRATPSSPSATVSTCSPRPGWRRWCSRADR